MAAASTSDPAEQVYAAVVGRITSIAELPEREQRDLRTAIRIGVRLLDDSAVPLTDADLNRLRRAVRGLARAGVPLADVVHCQELCGTRAVAALWAATDLTHLSALAGRLHRAGLRWHDLAENLLRVFLRESAALSGVPVPALVTDAVLDGWLTPGLAAVCDLPQQVDGYLVAALPAESRTAGMLAESGQPGLFWRYRQNELVLLTAVTGGTAGIDAARNRIADTLRTLLPAVGVPAVGVFRPQGLTAGVVEQSRQLRAFAVAADLAEVLYAPQDLAVDRGVAKLPEVVAGLRAIVAPLGAGTDLRQTLRTLYRMDLHRARTAEALGVHRQTLMYRLNRIRELTGMDPLSVRGVTVLVAALAADAEVPRP